MCIGLFIVPHCAFSKVSLSAIIKIFFAAFFECNSCFLHHLDSLHYDSSHHNDVTK